jgi:hypothetical protein
MCDRTAFVIAFALLLVSGAAASAQQVGPKLNPSPDAAAKRAPTEVVPLERLKILRQPSISDRHRAASTEGLPAGPVAVRVRCTLLPGGTLWGCTALDGQDDPAVRRAARRLANGYRFDPGSIDQTSKATLLVELSMQFSPDDLRQTTPPAGSTILSRRDVRWVQAPRPDSLWPSFDQPGLYRTVCGIQGDGSLVCGIPTEASGVRVGPMARQALEEFFRAGSTLADGSPSAGRWVEIIVSTVGP